MRRRRVVESRWPIVLALHMLLASAPLADQEQPAGGALRDRVFGQVRDASGAPAAGATVRLLSRPVPGDERVGTADLLTVSTDELGRFRVAALRGRAYTAWAARLGEDGEARASQVAEDVFPAVPVVLKIDEAVGAFRIRIRGRDAWQARAPFRCRVIATTRNLLCADLLPDDAGACEVPALPGSRFVVEVRGADDFPLLQSKIERPTSGELALYLPEPTPTLFGVRSLRTGGPLPGARIYQRLRQRLVPIGRTDDDGCLAVDLAVLRDAHRLSMERSFLALADGHGAAELISEAGLAHGVQDEAIPVMRAGAKPDLYCQLDDAMVATGRVLLPGGVPARRLALLVASPAFHTAQPGYRYYARCVRLSFTDDEGRFAIDGLFAKEPAIVHAVLGDEHIAELPPAWQPGLLPFVPFLFEPSGSDGKGGCGDVLLTDLRPVDLEISTHEGLPASHGAVQLYPLRRDAYWDVSRSAPVWHADRHGMLALLLRTDVAVALYVECGDDRLLGRIPAPAGEGDGRVRRELRLQEPWWIAGGFGDDVVLPGEPVTIYWSPEPGAGEVQRARLGAGRVEGTGVEPVSAEWTARFFAERWFQRRERIETDEDGRFRIAVPPVPMGWVVNTDPDDRTGFRDVVILRDGSDERVVLERH